ncbi:MAG: LacI family DNA-binding transcriptional regulator [Acidimicrobiia bacterium]
MKKPTIRDVATEAGVSVATVSRVLNDKPDASGESRRKVEDAVRKLGYARSSQWEQITTGKSRVISLHFPHAEPGAGQVYPDFITGVTTACEERDYRLHLITRPLDDDRLLDLYRSSKSDGVILMKVQLDDWRVDFLRSHELAFVMIGHTDNSEGVSYVDYDFEAAMRMGLEHLFGLGHRNIGYISAMPSSREQHGPTARSLHGYRASCEQMGIPPILYETDQSLRHVRLATSNMLNEHPDITALITMREMVEAALYGAIQDNGMHVPDDISVVGLANPQGPELTSPALTALDYPAWSMAYEAGRILIDQLEGAETTRTQVLREPTLTVRASTAPVRRSRRESGSS